MYPMLHEELYINGFVITLRMRKPPECDNSDITSTPDVAHTLVLQIGCVTNCLLHSEMEHLNWQTSSSFELGVEYIT